MIPSSAFSHRRDRRPRPASLAPVGALFLFLLAAGCGGSPDPGPELEALWQSADAATVEERCRQLLDEGVDAASVHLHLGLSLLQRDEDPEALRHLRQAAQRDSLLSPRISRAFAERSAADQKGRWRNRAVKRMRRAYEFDPTVEMGRLMDPVANDIYKERDYAGSLALYERLDGTDGPDKKQQEWSYRRAHCLEKTDEADAALDGYREYLRRWSPRSDFGHYSMLRFQKILLERAEQALTGGRAGEARDAAEEAIAPNWNPPMVQWGRYLIGRSYEIENDLPTALEWYQRVVDEANVAGDNKDEEWVRGASQRLADLGHDSN